MSEAVVSAVWKHHGKKHAVATAEQCAAPAGYVACPYGCVRTLLPRTVFLIWDVFGSEKLIPLLGLMQSVGYNAPAIFGGIET